MRPFRGCCLRLVTLALLTLAVRPTDAAPQTPQPSQTQATLPGLVPAAPGQTQRITLTDGSQLVGRIISVDSASVQFESVLGTSTILIASIVDVTDVSAGTPAAPPATAPPPGKFGFVNPNATRLIFAPTGRMLKKGEGYINDFWIFFPGFAKGIGDRFTIGGGMSILPGVPIIDQIIFITPKVGVVQKKRVNVAAGALAILLPQFDVPSRRTSVGVLYTVTTVGGPDASLTGGLGYGYVETRMARSPAMLLGGERRLATRFSLVSENYLLPGSFKLGSAAVRFMAEGMTADLGIAGNGNGWLPVLNVMWKW